MTDPRVEIAAKAIHAARFPEASARFGWNLTHPEQQAEALGYARAAIAAADKAATTRTFTGAEVNLAGWVCGACEPGDYAKCEDCQSACDDVAQFVNRMIRGTE